MHDRIDRALAAGQAGVLSAATAGGVWSMPVRYRSAGLQIDCLLPRWSDLVSVLEEDPAVVLVVLDPGGLDRGWLQVQGRAETVAAPDWAGLLPQVQARLRPEELYRLIRIRPVRFDLFDGRAGWGGRETLDM